MLLNELVGFKIGLNRYNNFFQQIAFCYENNRFLLFMDDLPFETLFSVKQSVICNSQFIVICSVEPGVIMQKLSPDFYQRNDVLQIAKELLGKLLVTQFEQQLTIGRIVETEAYNGTTDKASHAYGGRYTQRTQTMYAAGGCAYVYLCYGIHHLFNVVTGPANTPHAVLIRAVEPVKGISIMLQRMGKPKADFSIGRGPGNVTKALGISRLHNAKLLTRNDLYIADDGYTLPAGDCMITQRIGVDYAGEDAFLPYRFLVKENPYVSGENR